MNRFDDDLRASLRREAPPPQLADRVLARARAIERARPPRPSLTQWTIAAAAVAALSTAPLAYVQHLRAVRGEHAKAEVLAALHVAGSSLRSVQERLSDLDARRVKTPQP
jgi:hypothetical protein